jgi:ABC-type glycerol-3-phosphate transport system substrate-binding protein
MEYRGKVGRRGAIAVLAAVLSAGTLSACGGGEASGGGTSGGDGKLAATYMQSGTYDKAAESLVAGFKRSAGRDLTVQAFPFAALEQKNQTDLVTKTGNFDLLSVSSWDVGVYGNLVPLADRMDGWSVKSSFIPELLKDGPAPYFSGKPVGVPYAVDAYGVFARTDLVPDNQSWSTWDDFIAYLKQLQRKLPAGVAPAAFAFGAPEQIPAIFQGAYDGPWLNADGKWDLDDAKAVKALEIVQQLVKLGPPNAKALSIDEANAVFLQGKAATLIGWPSFTRGPLNDKSASKVAGKWRLAAFPGPGTPQLSNWALAISSLSDDPEGAWKWIDTYITPQNASKWMFEYGIGSPFQSTYDDPALLKAHANDLPIQKGNLGRAKPAPLTFQAFEAMYRVCGDMIAGKLTPQQAVTAFEQQWSQLPVPAPLLATAKAEGFVAE